VQLGEENSSHNIKTGSRGKGNQQKQSTYCNQW